MERKVLIIHHNDMDGKFSGALIYNYEKNKKNADWIKCIEVDYTMNLVNIIDEDILALEGLIVYFVDYSFSKKENTDIILSILDNNGRVVWIDHHVSSKNVLASLPDEICNDNRFKVIIDTKYCATVLCYEYTSTIKNDKAFLNLVDSWDCWKHTVPDDRFFNEGFRSMHYLVEELGDIVGDILKNKDAEDRFINKMIDAGKEICTYIDTNNMELLSRYGFEFNINYFGNIYKCLALFQYGNSMVFGDKINDYDIVSLIRFNGSQFVYSLYSNKDNIDCSKIATTLGTFSKLGGGGHKGAAGFQTYENIMYENCVIHVYKSLFSKKIKIKIMK